MPNNSPSVENSVSTGKKIMLNKVSPLVIGGIVVIVILLVIAVAMLL